MLVVEELLIDAMLERRRRNGTTTGMQEEHVRKVYERAGATGLVGPEMGGKENAGRRCRRAARH